MGQIEGAHQHPVQSHVARLPLHPRAAPRGLGRPAYVRAVPRRHSGSCLGHRLTHEAPQGLSQRFMPQKIMLSAWVHPGSAGPCRPCQTASPASAKRASRLSVGIARPCSEKIISAGERLRHVPTAAGLDDLKTRMAPTTERMTVHTHCSQRLPTYPTRRPSASGYSSGHRSLGRPASLPSQPKVGAATIAEQERLASAFADYCN